MLLYYVVFVLKMNVGGRQRKGDEEKCDALRALEQVGESETAIFCHQKT